MPSNYICLNSVPWNLGTISQLKLMSQFYTRDRNDSDTIAVVKRRVNYLTCFYCLPICVYVWKARSYHTPNCHQKDECNNFDLIPAKDKYYVHRLNTLKVFKTFTCHSLEKKQQQMPLNRIVDCGLARTITQCNL